MLLFDMRGIVVLGYDLIWEACSYYVIFWYERLGHIRFWSDIRGLVILGYDLIW
jgi:hypothetical protein